MWESYFKDWAQFDLVGDAWKDLLSSPTWGVCKHPQPEGELALKSEAPPFPTYLKYSQGGPDLSLSPSPRGVFCQTWFCFTGTPQDRGEVGWRFYFTKKFNHLSPIRYPSGRKRAAKRELWTSNVFRRIPPKGATTYCLFTLKWIGGVFWAKLHSKFTTRSVWV